MRKEALPYLQYGLACIFSRAIGHLRAGKQSCRSELGIGRAMEIDVLDLRRDAQHPGTHILATQKGALGDGTVRKADAISSSCTLDRLCKLAIERVIAERPDAEVTAAIDDGRKSAPDGEGEVAVGRLILIHALDNQGHEIDDRASRADEADDIEIADISIELLLLLEAMARTCCIDTESVIP